MTSGEGSVPDGGSTPGTGGRPAFDSLDDGIVRVEEWRQDPAASGTGRSSLWCGVGRKR